MLNRPVIDNLLKVMDVPSEVVFIPHTQSCYAEFDDSQEEIRTFFTPLWAPPTRGDDGSQEF